MQKHTVVVGIGSGGKVSYCQQLPVCSFDNGYWYCLTLDRKGIRPVKMLGVGGDDLTGALHVL